MLRKFPTSTAISLSANTLANNEVVNPRLNVACVN